MATFRLSPAVLYAAPSSPTVTSRISSSLRFYPFPLRSRFSSIKICTRRRRLAGGGSAAGATMSDSPASSYASALAEIAQSNNTLDVTLTDLENVKTFFSESSVQSFFTNPIFTDDKKLEVIKDFADAFKLQPYTINFLNILIDMKRIDLINDIVKEFEICFNRLTGTEVAVVSSVVKLESQHLAQIAKTVQKLTGAKNVRIKTVIDPSLIAGFTVRYGNTGSKLIDMSVKKQLDEIAAAARLDLSSIALV